MMLITKKLLRKHNGFAYPEYIGQATPSVIRLITIRGCGRLNMQNVNENLYTFKVLFSNNLPGREGGGGAGLFGAAIVNVYPSII